VEQASPPGQQTFTSQVSPLSSTLLPHDPVATLVTLLRLETEPGPEQIGAAAKRMIWLLI